jgi:hypothetical protein
MSVCRIDRRTIAMTLTLTGLDPTRLAAIRDRAGDDDPAARHAPGHDNRPGRTVHDVK